MSPGNGDLPSIRVRGRETPRTARCAIGLVGPMSNYAAPPQLVLGVPYRDVKNVHAFARRWRDEHRGQWFAVPKLCFIADGPPTRAPLAWSGSGLRAALPEPALELWRTARPARGRGAQGHGP
jgi:hypothetical protein